MYVYNYSMFTHMYIFIPLHMYLRHFSFDRAIAGFIISRSGSHSFVRFRSRELHGMLIPWEDQMFSVQAW